MATIDFDFLARLEGGQQLTAYVPAPEESQSGVTIATGFDLGARNQGDLQRLGLDTSLIEKLSPYLGLKKQEAVKALTAIPLSILAVEAKAIDQAVKSESLNWLEGQYNAAIASGKTAFAQLPTGVRTVIASVSFQYGDLPSQTPTFWKYVTAQDWGKAIAELRNFGDSYPSRRNQEADLLARSLGNDVNLA